MNTTESGLIDMIRRGKQIMRDAQQYETKTKSDSGYEIMERVRGSEEKKPSVPETKKPSHTEDFEVTSKVSEEVKTTVGKSPEEDFEVTSGNEEEESGKVEKSPEEDFEVTSGNEEEESGKVEKSPEEDFEAACDPAKDESSMAAEPSDDVIYGEAPPAAGEPRYEESEVYESEEYAPETVAGPEIINEMHAEDPESDEIIEVYGEECAIVKDADDIGTAIGAKADREKKRADTAEEMDEFNAGARAAKGDETMKLGIVVSEFNYDITMMMLERARSHADFLGAEVTHVVRVPGVFDMALAIDRLLLRGDVDGVVTLGCVMEGETGHDEVVISHASRKIADLSLEYGKPVSLGITGPGMSRLQAEARIERAKDAVEAVIKVYRAIKDL